MIQSLNKKWFIVQIKSNLYDLATRNLERQGFETFLPQMEITVRKENRFNFRKVYVFPGYIFVSFDPYSTSWAKINSTYGVSKLLAFNNKPSEISNDLISLLKNRYLINNKPTKMEYLEKGDSIKFNSGPFADLIARVENVDEKNRIWVLLEAMGGNRRLRLPQTQRLKYYKV